MRRGRSSDNHDFDNHDVELTGALVFWQISTLLVRLHWTQFRFTNRAITLVEVLVGVGIIAILAGIVFKAVPYLRDRAEGVRCVTNMRSLQVSLAAYVQDKGHWPQEPEAISGSDDSDAYEDWWLDELDPLRQRSLAMPDMKRLVM
jgi:hypothetical protein